MSFFIKDDEVWGKCDKIWDVIKDKLGIEFHSRSVYEYKYLKAKVRELDSVIKTFWVMLYQKEYALYLHCLDNY